MKITREFVSGSRYYYDFGTCSSKHGYAQVDTREDASYYGTWANPFKWTVVTYTEGDLTICQAESQEEFVQEIRKIQEFHGPGFIGIDSGFRKDLAEEFRKIGLGELLH